MSYSHEGPIFCMVELEFENDVFFRREENWSTRRKPHGASKNQQQTQATYEIELEIELRSHWWG